MSPPSNRMNKLASSPASAARLRIYRHGSLHGYHGHKNTAIVASLLFSAQPAGSRLMHPQAMPHPELAVKEEHKVFDQATITCRSGKGGNGEIIEAGKGWKVPNLKYRPNSGVAKQIWLPASEPADGQWGASVVLVADTSVDNLLHLHERSVWTAAAGANGDPTQGSQAPKRLKRTSSHAKPLHVPVPMGTIVKSKKGTLLAELLRVGASYCVCQGGMPGRGVVMPKKVQPRAQGPSKAERRLQRSGIEVLDVEDPNWREDARGRPGEEAQVLLQLRVVADAGFVGLPNAGKSSLLARMTAARPKVASYPFTTLMPNLGVLAVGLSNTGTEESAVLVDLPGLIEGAHKGRGLGRTFLRHLARTRMFVHVIDAAVDNPAADFWVVREELRLYNPQYCQRPCIVALNKMDLPDPQDLQEEIVHEIQKMAEGLEREHPGLHRPLVGVRCVSAETGEGIEGLVDAMTAVLRQSDAQICKESLDDAHLHVWGVNGTVGGALSSQISVQPGNQLSPEEAWVRS